MMAESSVCPGVRTTAGWRLVTRWTTRWTDTSVGRKKGAGRTPMRTAAATTGAMTHSSRTLRSFNSVFFLFVTGP
jgi:hypothetical protein